MRIGSGARALIAAAVGVACLQGPIIAGSPPVHSVQLAAIAPLLEPGTRVERTLRAGGRDEFRIDLADDEFLNVVVDQQGIDIALHLVAPDGTTILVSDSPNGTLGPERIAWIAQSTGTYRLEIASVATASNDSTPEGRYQLTVVARRSATPADVVHAEAERLVAEANPVAGANTAASRAVALEKYVRAAELFASLGLRYEQGLCLYRIGLMQLRAGEPRSALPPLTRAATLFDRGSGTMYASVVNALGGAHDLVGQLTLAMERYTEALELFTRVGDRRRAAIVRNNIGKLHDDAAEWADALADYRDALAQFREVGDRAWEALALQNIGAVYLATGEHGRGKNFMEQALGMFHAVNDRAREADALTQLGFSELASGNPAQAMTYLERALPLRAVVGDRSREGLTVAHLGRAYLAAGDSRRAVDLLTRASELRGSSGDKQGQARALTSLAEAKLLTGSGVDALDTAATAISIFRAMNDRQGLALVLPVVARAQRQLGRLDAALATIQEGLDALESVRGRVSNPEMRAAFLGTHYNGYALAIDLLMQLHREQPLGGFDALALQTSERARARSLLDLFAESGAQIRQGVDPSLAERERQIVRTLDAKADRLIALRNATDSTEADLLQRETRELEAEYEEIRAKIRAASPQYNALTRPQPLDADAIRRDLLDADTTLLEYSLGQESSFAWVLDRGGLKSYRLAPREQIEAAAREAYALVTSRADVVAGESTQDRTRRIAETDAALPAALRRVSDLVLAPIIGLPITPKIVVVADGALQYLPFEMLPVPRRGGDAAGQRARPLIADFEIVTLPSASTLAAQRTQLAGRGRASRGVAVFADPVFDNSDPRVRAKEVARAQGELPEDQARLLVQIGEPTSGGASHIPRLPFTSDEAKAILDAARGQQNLEAVGFAASKPAATASSLREYRYLHFATHGYLDTERPTLSAVALSLVDREGTAREGFLREHELYNLNLAADLVVLSACQTGLGKEIRGEGLVGLTRAFMYAGAARVIVSLWSVSDRATATLMGRLYREMLRHGKTPAAALRAAQLALLADSRWQHPYYWAPFVLQGDWN